MCLKYVIGVALVEHKTICGGYGACSTEFDRNDPCSAHDDCEKTECKSDTFARWIVRVLA